MARRPATPDPAPTAHDRHRERIRAYDAAESRSGRDIGPIPPIANVRRRSRGRDSFRLFCETYNAPLFYLEWSETHLKAITKIEETVHAGALYAFAMPRGFGKTALVEMAALWAIAYGFCRYAFIIGATATKGQQILDAIKVFMRLPEFAADFPEISLPAERLAGIANRAAGQLCQGEPTRIVWSQDRVILATVPPPPNWPKRWKLRSDGLAPTSGAIVGVSGLTGDGIRGSSIALTTGEALRPDLVLIDDPQTDESANSLTQCDTREQLVGGAVLGLAGPNTAISAFMPCTVIRPGDLAERFLDRTKHPLWRGERTPLLSSMPTNKDATDTYMEVYRAAVQEDPPNLEAAASHWREHQAELEQGAVATWPARKLPTDVSAIQYAINLLCRSPRAFWSEYQNAPLVEERARRVMSVAEILAKANGIPRGMVPQWATRLTAFVDVQGSLLYWAAVAWSEHFTGHVVDYGTYPEQRRSYFALRDARPTLVEATGAAGLEAQIFKGLTLCTDKLLARPWKRDDDTPIRIERLLVDSAWQTEVVRQWCRQCGRAEITPSVGHYTGPTRTPISGWKLPPGARRGLNWILSKHVIFDPNFWKTFVFQRFAVDEPMPGCLTLCADAGKHQLLIDHLTSETPDEVTAGGRTSDIWTLTPGRENHFLDCIVGNAVAASVQGVALRDVSEPAAQPAKRRSWKADYEAKRRERGK